MDKINLDEVVVQLPSCVWLFETPMDCSSPGFPVLHYLPEFAQMQCPYSQWCHSTISFSLVSFSSLPQSFPVLWSFPNKSALHIRWPKHWSFKFSISPSNKFPGLIFFKIYWLDLLAVQGTLKSLFQHHSSKASTLWCSSFVMAQL